MNQPTASFPEPDRTITATPPGETAPQSAESALASADRSLPLVPGYTLLEEVGRGGMGIVYRAHDTRLERDIAVKILQSRYAIGGSTAARFVEEAKITAQLQHPGIPAVHEVGTLADGRPFLAMKLIKGRSLADLIEEKSPINVAAVFEQIAQTVGYAHAHGVIHRDLKPANVMVGAFGEVQVMDWGLAKVLTFSRDAEALRSGARDDALTEIKQDRDSDHHTQAGDALGTPAFMPPEQALGAVDQMTPRSDVFGLGGILCMLLTGKPPFLGRDALSTKLLAAQGRMEDAFARLDASTADPELIALAKHCLAPVPDARLADGAAVADAVAKLRAAADDRARQAEVDRGKAEVQAVEQRKRRRVQLVFGTAVLATLAMGSALAFWQENKRAGLISANAGADAKRAAERDEENQQRIQLEINNSKRLQEEARKQRRVLDSLRIAEAATSFDNNLVEHARNTLHEVAEENRINAWYITSRYCEGSDFSFYSGYVNSVAWSPDGRTLATGCGLTSESKTIILWDVATGQILKELTGHTNGVLSVVWSPDGRILATGSSDCSARLWDASTGLCLFELKEHTEAVECVAWSPDGSMLATGSSDKTVRLWDTATGKSLMELKGHDHGISSVAWSPDSRVLACADHSTLWLWSVATGQTINKLKGHRDTIGGVAWNPDGRILATGGDNTAHIWDAATGQSLYKLEVNAVQVLSVAWSPDGRTLATAGSDHIVQTWDVATRQCLKVFHGHTHFVRSVTWSPDGRTLATGSWDKSMRLWDAMTGQALKELKGHKLSASSVAWSPDGLTLATGSFDASARLWDASTGQTLKTLDGHTHPVKGVAWSPNGRTLATASYDKTVRLWEAATGQTLKVLKGHTGPVACVAWSPDGRTLATGSVDTIALLWDTATGQTLKELTGHTQQIQSVAWSSDGRMLATGCADGIVRLWDAMNGQSLHELKGDSHVEIVAWSPDSRTLAAAGYETVRLWDAASGHIVKVFERA